MGIHDPALVGVPDADLRTNRLAMASLFLGLVGFCGIGSVFAVVLGLMARREIDDGGGVQPGRAMATVGIVFGAIQLAVIAVFALALVLG